LMMKLEGDLLTNLLTGVGYPVKRERFTNT
jgi:hypothetical protein